MLILSSIEQASSRIASASLESMPANSFPVLGFCSFYPAPFILEIL